jgi:hypothetical protein
MARRGIFATCFACTVLAWVACSDFRDCIYTARPYDADGACLDPSVAIGVVEATELASTCAPVCLSLDGVLYVSVVCPPYPSRAKVLSADDSPDCKVALGLMQTGIVCGEPEEGAGGAGGAGEVGGAGGAE